MAQIKTMEKRLSPRESKDMAKWIRSGGKGMNPVGRATIRKATKRKSSRG